MAAPRFFLPSSSIDPRLGRVAISDRELVRQMRKVLRASPGDPLSVLDGQGRLYRCVLTRLDALAAEARITAEEEAKGDPEQPVAMALPLLKGGRFEWALQKLTELGVSRVVPILAERSVVRIDAGKEGAKLRRWQAIMKEAAEQCERATIPPIVEPLSLRTAIQSGLFSRLPDKAGKGLGLRLLCAERRDAPLMRELIDSSPAGAPPPGSISVIVGPEGGLADDEVTLACQQGWQPVSLGPRILRAETAAVCAIAQLRGFMGD